MIKNPFSLTGGTVIGRDHYIVKKNNQDSYFMQTNDELIVGIVTDGCGDYRSTHSEVGANIGARLIANTIARHVRLKTPSQRFLSQEIFWEKIRQDCLAQIRVLALNMGNSLTEVISTFFLFTCVSVVITPTDYAFALIGDGVIIMNNDILEQQQFPNNEPPYMCYALLDPRQTHFDQAQLEFKLISYGQTSELNSFLIGTDGTKDLIRIGGIENYWLNPSFYTNPFALSRKLAVINKEQRLVNWEEQKLSNTPGLLSDDTTLIAGLKNIV